MADMAAKGRHAPVNGEKAADTELTWETVNEMRFTYYFAPWVPHRFLGKCYGLSKSAVGHILREETWKEQ